MSRSKFKTRWTNKELEYVKQAYPLMPRKQIAKKLGRTIGAVAEVAAKFGVKRERTCNLQTNYYTGKSKYITNEAGCWIWQGGLNRKGYPIGRGKDSVLAHRQSYINRHGEIPQGYTVDHLCRVRSCINPAHLEAVPHVINVIRGTKTKLNAEQVNEIRSANIEHFKSGNRLDRHFAEKFGVWPSTVYFARKGTSWRERNLS